MTDSASDQILREEFNRWAEAGKGESMENEHRPIVEPTLDLMCLAPADVVLDVGCGGGWLVREIASRVPQGRVAGMDVSDEMIARARRASTAVRNAEFLVGAVDAIPRESNSFDKVISVESSYYWPDPAWGIREVFRVSRPGGSAWILINYYRDNRYCHQWAKLLAVPTQLLFAGEWADLFRAAGFTNVAHQRIIDPTPAPEVYTGRWFRDAAELAAFRREGALLVHGVKPLHAITNAICEQANDQQCPRSATRISWEG
ncbi:MAG TPA: methyltransferase domain-containing protein [Candidatus Methylomirabilis sp.]|nr:methyltransferase domain-containing protein [Candidatus Methylomirabilis sp.]